MDAKRKIILNSIIYAIRQIMSVLFPLISFAYASRILGVNNIGKVNYANSIITYFVILSGLGLATYAIKVGSTIRDKQKDINEFTSQMFSINLISTFISMILCIILIFSFNSLKPYKYLLLVFMLLIPFTTLGIDWLYNIYEDFAYITIRTIAFQALSVILLFIFVKNENDIIKYALITVLATVGSNLSNLIHSRKYVIIRVTLKGLKKHIIPILLLFGMTISTTIYTNMDTTMIGILSSDYYVGLYSAAHKIIKVLVQMIGVIRTVSLPLLSIQAGAYEKNDDEFKKTSNVILNTVILVSLPIAVVTFISAGSILTVLAGEKYLPAVMTLRYLSVDVFFSAMSGTLVYQYVLLKRGEKPSFIITVIGTIVNLILNYFLILKYQSTGAAIATCISEITVFILASIESRKYINWNITVKHLFLSLLGCTSIVFFHFLLKLFWGNSLLSIIIAMVLGLLGYFIILIKIGNNVIEYIYHTLIKNRNSLFDFK